MENNTYDTYAADTIKFGELNRSPVLYLRRRRDTDYHRPFNHSGLPGGAYYKEHLYVEGGEESSEPVWAVDKGHIYPNHESLSRLSSIEWVKFRDFKKRWPVKWIRSQQLIVDGESL